MAVKIELKRSSVPGKIPTTASLELGELAINTYDGVAYLKREVNTTQSIVALLTTAYTGSYMESSSYAQTASYAPNYTLLISFDAFTSSYNTGSFTGSFFGDGSGLTNLPTQSISIDTGSFATTGSNRFNGNQIITGSLIQGLEGNIASGEYSHAEGSITKAIGDYSHAEGDNTQAKGNYSHAEGLETIASGSYSHAEGSNTIASANYQHVQGQWNITSSVEAAFILGNGTDDSNRSNLVFAAGNTFQVTGSLNVSAGITGSLFGTASWAQNAVTASYFSGSISNATFAVTSSYAFTASYIDPANLPTLVSYQITTGSVTASVNTNINQIFLIKSGSTTLVNVNNSGSITTSGSITINTTGSYDKLLSINNNQKEYLGVNGEGVLVLNQFATPPTAISGGIYLDTVGDFYFGV